MPTVWLFFFFLVNYGNLIVALASYMAGKAQFS